MTTSKDSFEEIKMKLFELEIAMFKLNEKMDMIVESLEKDCKKMSSHIDFVENVYEKVKQPFSYLMDNVSNIMYKRITYSRAVEEKPQRIDNRQTESPQKLNDEALKEWQW